LVPLKTGEFGKLAEHQFHVQRRTDSINCHYVVHGDVAQMAIAKGNVQIVELLGATGLQAFSESSNGLGHL
jgi:hypothetical protein